MHVGSLSGVIIHMSKAEVRQYWLRTDNRGWMGLRRGEETLAVQCNATETSMAPVSRSTPPSWNPLSSSLNKRLFL